MTEETVLQNRSAVRTTRWLQIVLLVVVLAAGLAVRLVNLQNPPMDFHPVRQLRSMIIARGMLYQIDPTYDAEHHDAAINLMNLQDVHEPPINEAVVAATYKIIGSEQWWVSRIYSSLWWLIGGLALFYIARKFTSFFPAIMGLAFYLFLPFSVFASRSFQPDPFMAMWVLLALAALVRWSERLNWKWAVITGLLCGMAILVKVMAGLFVAATVALYLFGMFGFRRTLRNGQVWAVAGLALLPAAIFYLGFHAGRSGEYFSYWTLSMLNMLLSRDFYTSWLGMAGHLVTYPVLMLGLIGTFTAKRGYRGLLMGFWAGYIAFGLAWPFQYTTHDYYQLMLIPLLGLSIAPALEPLLGAVSREKCVWRWATVMVFVFASVYSLWSARSSLAISDYSNEAVSWQRVGESIPPNASFAALTPDYGLRLQYYGWRIPAASWPLQADLYVSSLHGNSAPDTQAYFTDMTQGIDLFLVASGEIETQTELKTILTENYPVYYEGTGWTIYDLQNPLP